MSIRVDHRTVTMHVVGHRLVTAGYAATGGECPEHGDCHVERDEPIVLRHKAIAEDETGRFVDLSAAEWGCQRGAA